MMPMTRDDVAERQRQMAEQAVAAEDARKKNVRIFEAMWLSLGPDVLKLAGTRHDAELMESRGLAMSRWNQLIGMESQAEREEAALATRPKKRPIQPTDDALPDRTLEQQGRAWEEETKVRRESLAALKDQAKAERRELESFMKAR